MNDYSTVAVIAYIGAFATSMVFFGGYMAGLQSKEFTPLSLAPLLACLLAGPFWAAVAKHEMGVPEVASEESELEERRVTMGQTIHMDDMVTVGGPVLLENCDVILVGQKGGSARLRIKAVTAKAFVQLGWQYNFSAGKMTNKVLDDGRKTKITESLWTQITDGMHKVGMIRKEHRKPTVSLLSLQDMLKCTMPYPTPAGWHNWT